jgi:hypothetical protein
MVRRRLNVWSAEGKVAVLPAFLLQQSAVLFGLVIVAKRLVDLEEIFLVQSIGISEPGSWREDSLDRGPFVQSEPYTLYPRRWSSRAIC